MAKPKFFYDNRLADATVAASTTAAGYAALNVVDWRPYTWWKPTALPATLTVDCGSAKAADYALCYGHDLFTQGCTFEVRGSTDNFGASNVLVATVTPADNNPFILTFGSVSYRYWRVRITGAATMPSLAIAAIGAVLDLYTYLPQGFDPIGAALQGQSNRNENGQPLGRAITYRLWKQSVKVERVTWTWLRSTFMPAYTAHFRSKPFVFAWEATLYPADLKLVTMGDALSSPHQAGQYADLQFDLMAVVA
jgi:hypothetical protein